MKRTAAVSLVISLLFATAAAAAAPSEQGATYPVRPIRILVPYTPGTAADIVARMVGQRLTAVLGQQTVIENREGASGTIAAGIAARANPDGYTLLLAQASYSAAPHLYKKLPYDPIKSFAPITLISVLPSVFVASPGFPAATLKELMALARAQPGKLQYASSGRGTQSFLVAEMLKAMAQLDIPEVPYKSSAQALIDTMTGAVAFNTPSLTAALGFLKSGKLRALAVTSAKRSQLFPDVPTVAEFVPGYEAAGYFGIVAPAGTPRSVIALLQKEIVAGMLAPETKERLINQGAEVIGSTPEQFGEFIRRDSNKWSKLIDDLKIPKE